MKNEKMPKSKSEEKWASDMNCTTLQWNKIYVLPIKCTIDTLLREFQYKFLKRIIPTNTFLFKCKIANSRLCDFCLSDIETVKHLFWDCKFGYS